MIEEKRYHAQKAVMLVHSFSQESRWFDDFQAFAVLYGKNVAIGTLVHATQVDGIDLYLGWVKGNARYLDV